MRSNGIGILTWEGGERRTNRYGGFTLDCHDYNGEAEAEARMDSIRPLIGRRVKITCTVLVARNSGHAGDRALRIYPSRPEVGEEIVLGVGILDEMVAGWSPTPHILLRPNDGRTELWIDPRLLFRLHDQTVAMVIEETTDDFTPAPDLIAAPSGSWANGDGTFQMKRVQLGDKMKVTPSVTNHGDGLFVVSTNFAEGEAVKIVSEQK